MHVTRQAARDQRLMRNHDFDRQVPPTLKLTCVLADERKRDSGIETPEFEQHTRQKRGNNEPFLRRMCGEESKQVSLDPGDLQFDIEKRARAVSLQRRFKSG